MHAARLLLALLCLSAPAVHAQATDDAFKSAVMLGHGFWPYPNQTYLTASGRDLKVDVIAPARAKAPVPVMIYFHGGGWVAGARENRMLLALPYLQLGFAVVNVEYRLSKTALAPAAVEDALCALQWVGRNAKKFSFDVSKVVASGDSAGGHLALATAMLPSDSPFTNQCAATETSWSGPYTNSAPKVAAVVNWFGITDLADMLQGPNIRSYAVSWFGSQSNRMELARGLSPIHLVQATTPPVLTVHGDADKLVPYAHARRLHAALDKAGVKNQLHTIKGGDHGDFTAEQQLQAYEAARAFLQGLGIVPAR
jgi:acetyl esterase/lipase